MKIILALLFCAFTTTTFAASMCWEDCANGTNSTATCAQKCGIRSADDQVKCDSYCYNRGGSQNTCENLCTFETGGSDCVFHPEKYGCHQPGDSYCVFHPETLGCHVPGDNYCIFHPDAAGCAEQGGTYCTFHPEAVGCHSPGDNYCIFHVEVLGCHEPGDNYCIFHPNDDGC